MMTAMPDPDRLLTPKEAADYLHISEKSVRRLIKGGNLPVIRLGRSVRVLPADLEALVRANRHA